jgi:general secretion pathway protein N
VSRRPAPPSAPAARRPYWLIALGLAAALLFALALLPAQFFAGRLAPLGLEAGEVSGTVWNGRIAALAWRGVPVGELRWQAKPMALLRGRAGAHLQLLRSDGRIETDVYLATGGRIELRELDGELPIEAFAAFPSGLPKGWRGRLRGRLAELDLSAGLPTAARGAIEVLDLIGPPPRSFPSGSYTVVLPHPSVQSAEGELDALIEDSGGPFDVEARLTLSQDRSFLLEGLIASTGSVPEQIRRGLELLGPADASGRREFSVAGTL